MDLERRRITIRRRYYRGTVRATKNHRMRTLELPGTTIPTLERLIREAGDVEPIPPLGDCEHDAKPFLRRWLIQTATGRLRNDSAFDKALGLKCAAVIDGALAGLDGVRAGTSGPRLRSLSRRPPQLMAELQR